MYASKVTLIWGAYVSAFSIITFKQAYFSLGHIAKKLTTTTHVLMPELISCYLRPPGGSITVFSTLINNSTGPTPMGV